MSDEQTITVTGFGSAAVEPDVVVIALGVEVVSSTPAVAFEHCGAALAQVRAVIADGGVPEQHVQTTRLALQPEWEHAGGRPRPAGYTARAGIGLTVVDPSRSRLGELLTAIVEAGGDAARVHALNWRASDPIATEAAARESAFTDARRRADQYAALAGRTLGAIVRVNEGRFDGRPVHHYGGVALAASAAMEVDPGEVDVNAAVTVTWELV